MSKVLRINKGADESVCELLRFLLKSKKVKGVLTLQKIGVNGAVSYSLGTSVDALESAVPLYPLMPTNAGGLLSRLTLMKPITEPVAAVVRPCELRAFIELVKRNQGSLENLLFISSTCGGVYPLEMIVNGNLTEELPKYWEAIQRGEIVSNIRPTCNGCIHFVPYNADITVALIGKKDIDKQCELFLNTDKGEKFVDGFEGQSIEGDIESEEVKLFRSKREAQKKKLFEEVKVDQLGMDGLIDTFGKCIGCHGCSRVCPICYCNLCFFDSQMNEYEPTAYDVELRKRGGLRVPPDTIFYQLGRLTHVSISCVGCGSCTDVCPANIPLSTIFLRVGESVQDMFNYLPGKDVEEPIPLTTFETEEFAQVEE